MSREMTITVARADRRPPALLVPIFTSFGDRVTAMEMRRQRLGLELPDSSRAGQDHNYGYDPATGTRLYGHGRRHQCTISGVRSMGEIRTAHRSIGPSDKAIAAYRGCCARD